MKTRQHSVICPMIIPAQSFLYALDGVPLSDRRISHGRSVTVTASGIIPKKTVVATHSNEPVIIVAKCGANTKRSASSRNRKIGTICAVHAARSVPKAPPAKEMTTLSDKSSPANSMREAPSATRRRRLPNSIDPQTRSTDSSQADAPPAVRSNSLNWRIA